MISALQHPRPNKNLDEQCASKHASPLNPNTRANLRSHSLPTPAPSPAPSLSQSSTSASSSAFSSPLVNMLALGNPAVPFAPFTTRTFSPFAPPFTSNQSRAHMLRQCMPMTPDASCLVLPSCESDQFESFRASKSRVVRLSGFPASSDASARAVASLFPLFVLQPSGGSALDGINRPTPVRMWTLRANSVEQDGDRPVWAVFASHEEACAALSLGYGSGVGCSSVSVIPALESELEPFSKLQAFTPRTSGNVEMNSTISTQSAVMGLQTLMRYPPSPTSTNVTDAETEAELFFPDAREELDFGHGLGFGYGYNHAQALGGSKSTTGMASAVREQPIRGGLEVLQAMQACHFGLSTNVPKRTGFRHGDWICAVPVCAAHNFGRNVTCIQCSSPRPSSLTLLGNGLTTNTPSCSSGITNVHGSSSSHSSTRVTSPRFSNTMNMQSQGVSQQRQQQEFLMKAQLQPPSQTHSLLTPSGRAFAVGGKVQNISPDPLSLAPCVMFWPDNEPFPDPGQIRPATLASGPHPPILNTGNKGPIERQPGDWTCQKCQHLNWRRRKVCQMCFPYAEGNGDSVSMSMHAERLALLAAVYGQTHPQITNAQQAHAAATERFPGRAQSQDGTSQIPVSNASNQYTSIASNAIALSSLPNYPFNNVATSSHRSQVPSVPVALPARRTPIPPLSISTSVTNLRSNGGISQPASARRVQSILGESYGEGNIVYQTPPSPAVMRPPPSISSPLALSHDHVSPQTASASPSYTGPLLPSFINREVQPMGNAHQRSFATALPVSRNGTRSPASLSPASSASADLPNEEYENQNFNALKSVGVIGSGRNYPPPPSANAGAGGAGAAATFYAHPLGASSGSSMGSASSLTLSGGSSIWSLERNEDKVWNSGGFVAATQSLKKLTI